MLETDRGLINRLVRNFAGPDLSIDLGTSNILIYQKGRGIVVNEPSVVAYQTLGGGQRKICAIGKEARAHIGKTPAHIELARPLKDGVIADSDFTEVMLKHFIEGIRGKLPGLRPLLVVSLPHGVTAVERQAVRQAARAVGAREVYLVAEPMAAALGAGLPVRKPHGHLLVDMGGGTTEVALISLGGIVDCESIRLGGDRLDELVKNFVKEEFNLAIGDSSAENIKISLGTALPDHEIKTAPVKGLDMLTGLPRCVTVSSKDIGNAIAGSLSLIAEALREMLSRIPPELASDVVNSGITLTGGGSQLAYLDVFLESRLGLPVNCAENPMYSVALGGGIALEDRELLEIIAL